MEESRTIKISNITDMFPSIIEPAPNMYSTQRKNNKQPITDDDNDFDDVDVRVSTKKSSKKIFFPNKEKNNA